MASITPLEGREYERVNGTAILDEPKDAPNDVVMTESDNTSRLIIAFDFGTTFSSVAYAAVSESMNEAGLSLSQIRCIAHYPDDNPTANGALAWEPREDVPTELWYAIQDSDLLLDRFREERPAEVIIVESDSDADLDIAPSDDEEELPATSAQLQNAGHSQREIPYWGFEVQRQLSIADIPKNNLGRLARFKLMLANDDKTAPVRADVMRTIKALKRAKLLKKDAEIVEEYLLQLFLHTKDQLINLGFPDTIPIEFVLCVPAEWPNAACRTMQSAMNGAAERSGLRNALNTGLSDLFIVSEPEAAAACVLEEIQYELFNNDTIVIIDAGGGTVDAVTYDVKKAHPLRLALSKEISSPGTELCGSSYINQRFEEILTRRLASEDYLEQNDKTIKSIVDAKVIEFENGAKRYIDTNSKNCGMQSVWIDNLRENQEKGFQANRLHFSTSEIRYMFEESLKGASKLLKTQLNAALEQQRSVQKVFLIGGFGNSPSLRNYLRRVLKRLKNHSGNEIELCTPRIPSTSVARGAIVRAFRKADGPERITTSSYGFSRSEPYEPDYTAAHRHVRCKIDPVDGERYVNGTIDWLIQKDDCLQVHHEVSILAKHVFKLNKKKLICCETLYVSDEWHESHYRRTHTKNKGAQAAGRIEADMTFLRDDGHIQPMYPTIYSTHEGGDKNAYWQVEFDLVMLIDGRNLRYEARWPPKSYMEESNITHQVVRASGQICIAAGFDPGTE